MKMLIDQCTIKMNRIATNKEMPHRVWHDIIYYFSILDT